MRTAIFLGLTSIASAIRKDWLTNENSIAFLAVALIIMIFMDVMEFIKKMRKTS